MSNGNLVTTIEIKDSKGRVIDTKEVVTYAGLLNRAHQEGLKKVSTELIQAPSKANEMTAISMAEVETEKGVFRDYGDASPENVDSRIIPHIIRMSVTRAKARALRDAVNIGIVALEELGNEYQNAVEKKTSIPAHIDAQTKPQSVNTPKSVNKAAQSASKKPDSSKPGESRRESEGMMSEAQRRYLFRILAENGVNADAGQEYLKQTFGVNSLKEVTKAEASEMINLLLNDATNMLAGVAA
ncbi:hypothetical protein TRIP_C60034 [Candidatus Zixiibacteriota bacterium]|nr:hypothetical protein TRIP_C60034 [candidate division Zixibacteria bacterium]